MRVKLAGLTTLAAAAIASAALGQQAAAPAPVQPTEPQPLAIYQGTNGSFASGRWTSYGEPLAQSQPIYAVIGDHLVSGATDPSGAKTGLTLVDETQPEFMCRTQVRGGELRLACSHGLKARLTLQPFTEDAGCGHSRSGAPASLCYGFKPKYAAQRLAAPAGQKLLIEYGHLALKPAA